MVDVRTNDHERRGRAEVTIHQSSAEAGEAPARSHRKSIHAVLGRLHSVGVLLGEVHRRFGGGGGRHRAWRGAATSVVFIQHFQCLTLFFHVLYSIV